MFVKKRTDDSYAKMRKRSKLMYSSFIDDIDVNKKVYNLDVILNEKENKSKKSRSVP